MKRSVVVSLAVGVALAAGGGWMWRQRAQQPEAARAPHAAPAVSAAEQPVEFAPGDVARCRSPARCVRSSRPS
jgi:hypothetical protein